MLNIILEYIKKVQKKRKLKSHMDWKQTKILPLSKNKKGG